MAKNCKILQKKNSNYLSKIAKYSIYPEASVKDVQASGKASRHQKENIQHFKTTIFFTFFFIGGPFFANLDPDPADQNQRGSMRIQISNTVKIDCDS
jgi:hypothetical protein